MEKITVFEAFAGYGSQSMALERLKQDIGLDYTVVGISEIDATAIKAYYAARDAELLSRCRTVGDVETAIRGGVRASAGTYRPLPELWRHLQNQLGECAGFQSVHIQLPLYRHQQCRFTERTRRGVWHKVIASMGVRKGNRNQIPQIPLDGKRQGSCKRQIHAGFQAMGDVSGKPRLHELLSSAELKRLWRTAEPRARLHGQHPRRGYLLFPQTLQVRPPPQARIGNECR